MAITRGRFGAAWVLAGALVAGMGAAGCSRDEPRPDAARAEHREQSRERVAPPPEPPEYTIRRELRGSYPDVTTFVENFLATCLAGDYAGYRKLVSQRRTPESRERFQAVYYALRDVVVDRIEPIDLPHVPGPSYRVECDVSVRPDQPHAVKWQRRRIAILVLREEGEWRMVPAPSELQPPLGDEPTPASAPATREAAPDYPWEDTGG